MKSFLGTALMLVLFCTHSTWAEDAPNCKTPKTQTEMAQCVGLEAEKSDVALNELLTKIKVEAEVSDKNTGKTEYVDALLASQRAWLAFRDSECTWQAFADHGGTSELIYQSMCKAKVTKQRIKQLQTGVSE
jgi:uncharacterized protein YecT (DUF1311 family)